MAITTPDINRPEKYLVEGLRHIGSATASGELYRLGLRNPVMLGPDPWTAGQSVVGPALTLQFMPKREDQYDVDEYADPETQPPPCSLPYPGWRCGGGGCTRRPDERGLW